VTNWRFTTSGSVEVGVVPVEAGVVPVEAGVVSDAVWHANAESGRIPNAKNLTGTSHAKPGSGILFPKGVQVPDGAVYGPPEHAKVPPGGSTVYLCPPASRLCGGIKRVVFCGPGPTCATAGTAIPNTIASITAGSINFLLNIFPPPFFSNPCACRAKRCYLLLS
jgi:hypothetical protein